MRLIHTQQRSQSPADPSQDLAAMASAMDAARDKASKLGDGLSRFQTAAEKAKCHLGCGKLSSMRRASKITHAEIARVEKDLQEVDAAIADADELEVAAEQARVAAEQAEASKAHFDKLLSAAQAKKVAAAEADAANEKKAAAAAVKAEAAVAAAAASRPGSSSSPLCIDGESGDEGESQEEVAKQVEVVFFFAQVVKGFVWKWWVSPHALRSLTRAFVAVDAAIQCVALANRRIPRRLNQTGGWAQRRVFGCWFSRVFLVLTPPAVRLFRASSSTVSAVVSKYMCCSPLLVGHLRHAPFFSYALLYVVF